MEAVDFHFEDSLIDPYDEGLHGVNQSDNIAFVQILWASLGLLTSIVVSVQLVLHQTNSRRRIALAEAPKETHQDAWVRPVFPWVPGVKRRFLTVVLEILLHGIVWAVVHVADKGWSSVGVKVVHHDFIRAGFVGWVALALILVLSLPPVRAACYEALVNIHILLATIIIGSTIAHCKLSGFDLPHTPWNIAAAVLWAVERLLRALRLVRYSLTRQGRTITDIETIEGTSNMCRITMNLPCRVDIKPGPYGGHTSLDSYGHVVLIAGASGITHQIGYARRLVLGFNSQTTATRRIVLVWVI
ncbi:ferric reductase like transmembrane component [Colletotrichum graminicola]|nr:ferric reductase like transmembrane component [Colletotrichum graminicola]